MTKRHPQLSGENVAAGCFGIMMVASGLSIIWLLLGGK